MSALHIAVSMGHSALAKLLIVSNADYYIKTNVRDHSNEVLCTRERLIVLPTLYVRIIIDAAATKTTRRPKCVTHRATGACRCIFAAVRNMEKSKNSVFEYSIRFWWYW